MTTQTMRVFLLLAGKKPTGYWTGTIADDATTPSELVNGDGESLGEALAGETILGIMGGGATCGTAIGISRGQQIVLAAPAGVTGRLGEYTMLPIPHKIEPTDLLVGLVGVAA